MTAMLSMLLKISLVLFMVGNLLDMGLVLKIREALAGLRNVRFVALSLLCGFVLCPALAWTIATVVPMGPPYALGLILLGMTPCAPFLPMMVRRARGDMGYAAAFMLLASVVTVVYMPLAVPLLAKGLTADAWTIAKPLLFFMIAPMAAGMAIRRASETVASKIQPFVKKVTLLATLVMLVLCVVVYGSDFLGAVGSYAFGAQILFFSIATAASYGFSAGLRQDQRSVMSLGMSTRNLGAALAPLFAAANIDQRTIVMVVIGVPMQVLFSMIAARWFGRIAGRA